MKNWTLLKDLITLKPFPASILFLVSSFILVIPDKTAKFLSIESFRKEYRSWIVILTIIAGVTLFCHFVRYCFFAVKIFIAKHKTRKQLFTLSREEKLILYYCVRKNSATVLAPQGNCFLQALCSKGLMEKAGGTGTIFSWPYTIPTWVWNHLQRQSVNLFSEFNDLDQDKLMQEIETILKHPMHILK